MPGVEYYDFDMEFEPAPQGYRVEVNSPAGQAAHVFALPFSNLELENFVLRLGQARGGLRRADSPEVESAKQFGARLFGAIFGDEVRGCLRSSLDEAQRQGIGLRIRLRLTEAPELANIPWEYLYNPALNRFLALSTKTPLVRYLELPERIRPLAVTTPLRIMTLIASPRDYAPLNVEREWARLREALQPLEQRGLLVLERLEPPTLTALQRRLRRETYHILHFVGHGAFDQQQKDGVLILEDEDRHGYRISGQDLGMLLHDHDSLRLAILNACEGARSASDDPFAGAAQSLVQQGVPAVIAMQFAITDSAAITLAQEFYGAVADGYPADAALAEARKAVFAQGNGLEWGTPVLHLRAPDGRIFEVLPAAAKDPPVAVDRPERISAPVERPPADKTLAAQVSVGPAASSKMLLPGCQFSMMVRIAAMLVLLLGVTTAGALLYGLPPGGTTAVPTPAPATALASPAALATVGATADQADDDQDHDGLSNSREQALGTRPDRADTDGDGLNDGVDPDPRNPAAPTSLPTAMSAPTSLPTPAPADYERWDLLQSLDVGSVVTSVAFSPDGTLLASASDDGITRLWNLADTTLVATLKDEEGQASGITSVAFSPNGAILASAGHDNAIRFWDVAERKVIRTLVGPEGHTGPVQMVVFSHDGQLLASGGDDRTIRLWRVVDGTLLHVLEGHSASIWGLAFSPDDSLLASGANESEPTGQDTGVRIWNVADGAPLRTCEGHTSGVLSVAFSPDGHTLASGAWDRTARLWNVADCAPLHTLEGHPPAATGMVFSRDGQIIATAAGDGIARIWRVADGKLLRALEGRKIWASSVALSPDGRMLALGLANKTIRLWGARP